jgi:adenylate cyclase
MNDRLPRKLAAILYADVAGYSRLTGEDEDATHRILTEYLDLISATIESHGGKVMHYAGDAVLAQFSAVVDALSASIAIQDDLQNSNAALPDERKVQFRIGLNLGDVIEDRGDIYGDGVNVAARLEALAEPGSICISDAVRTAIGSKLPLQYTFIGEHSVKNIREPVRAYRVSESVIESSTPSQPANKSDKATTTLPFGKPSITVKPFEDIGADAEKDRLGYTFASGIAVALTRLPGLVHVQDESPAMAESKQMTVEEIGRQFNVRYVLKGSVQKIGNRIRVSAELLEISTGKFIWAENLDRAVNDVGDFFGVQDEIIEEIVTALDVKLLVGEAARLVRRAFKDPVALDRYYQGEDLLWRSTMKLEFREAQHLFEESIRLEPNSPVGYAAGALAHWVEAISGLSDDPSHSLERATELAHEAIRLEDVTGYAHMVLAHVYLNRREYVEAMSEATKAVIDRPSCPASYAIKASVLTYLDQAAEAVEFAQYAMRLTPVHPPMYPAVLASAYYGCDRFNEAVVAAKEAIDLKTNDVGPYLYMAASNIALDRKDDANRSAKAVIELEPDFSLANFAETQPYKEPKTLEKLITRINGAGIS